MNFASAPATRPSAALTRRPPLPALTGLRFLLAGHVLLLHFAPRFFGETAFAQRFIGAGTSAVTGFFLLSGFILTYAHMPTQDSPPQSFLNVRPSNFWTARFLRIYPAYFLAFLLSAPFALAQWWHTGAPPPQLSLAKTAAFLLMLQTWVPGLSQYWNYPAWSLSVESFFYALFPLLASAIFRQRFNPWLALSIVWIAGLIAPLLALTSVTSDRLLDLPPLHLPEFLFGMILGKEFLLRHEREPGRAENRWLGVAAAACLIIAYGSGRVPGSLIDHGLLAPIIACLFWSLGRGDGLLSWLLSCKPIIYLGEISYGIYILQFPIFTGCFVIVKHLGTPWNTRATFISVCFVLILAAASSFEFIETPVRRAGISWLNKVRA